MRKVDLSGMLLLLALLVASMGSGPPSTTTLAAPPQPVFRALRNLSSPANSVQLLNFTGHKLPWPAGQLANVTQKDGQYHASQVDFDIRGGGTPGTVYASRPGTVVFVKESSNSGCQNSSCWRQANMVIVQHASNEYSWYVHLAYNSVPVSVGNPIGFGTPIGVEGTTGYTCNSTCTGPGIHLHYMTSTGHTTGAYCNSYGCWTDPNNANDAPWATGITAVDFVEVSWAGLTRGQSYTSQNTGGASTYLRIDAALRDPTNGSPVSESPPLRRQRPMFVQIFNDRNELVLDRQIIGEYDSIRDSYLGAIDLGSTWTTGAYQVKVRLDYTLVKLVQGISTIINGSTNILPQAALKTGDVNSDRQIDVNDFNILKGCYSDFEAAKNCDASRKQASDLTGDGQVNQYDYNLWLRTLMKGQTGD
jgi:murein DD-endopeptidase MepM/ murein hydrolase activator NlpD